MISRKFEGSSEQKKVKKVEWNPFKRSFLMNFEIKIVPLLSKTITLKVEEFELPLAVPDW